MTIIVLLIVVLSFASGQQVAPPYSCAPGQTYYVQCNTCQCQNGQLFCTNVQCASGPQQQQPVQQGYPPMLPQQNLQQPVQQYPPTFQQQSPQQSVQQIYQPTLQPGGQPIYQQNIQPGQPAQNNPPTIVQNFIQTPPQNIQQQAPQQAQQQAPQQSILGIPLLQGNQPLLNLGLSVPVFLG